MSLKQESSLHSTVKRLPSTILFGMGTRSGNSRQSPRVSECKTENEESDRQANFKSNKISFAWDVDKAERFNR